MKSKYLIIALFIIATSGFGQSTYKQVYSIFQTKCSGCHNASTNAGLLNLSGSASAVYTSLVNHNPVNPASLSRGDKRVVPGYPHNSYLMRKINNGLDADNDITVNEGARMPQSPNPALSQYETELIRQWILHGAPQTGSVVDTAAIYDYYTRGGVHSIAAPLAPPAGSGFQVHLGKVFLPKNSETEIFIKYDAHLLDTVEINRIEISQSPESHHFVIYKFYPGQAVNFPEGLRDTTNSSHGSADFLAVFSPLTHDHVLPPTTAYHIPKTTVFDLNYHILNSNPDSVLGAEVYFNVYTQPKGTAQKFMYSRFFPDLSIILPPHDTTRYTQVACDSAETNLWEIWIMYTHTHKYGINYNVWDRNADGSKGPQVYNGYYDFGYTFNQGYYAWGVEAPEEHFQNPFLEVNPLKGLIHEATWYNSGTDTVRWGLTSKDEMMVLGLQYTYGPPIPVTNGIRDLSKTDLSFRVYPNPFHDAARIGYTLKERSDIKLEVFNLAGQKISTIASEMQNNGTYSYSFSPTQAGMYFLSLTVNGRTYQEKLIKIN
jgi:hypothetical protein